MGTTTGGATAGTGRGSGVTMGLGTAAGGASDSPPPVASTIVSAVAATAHSPSAIHFGRLLRPVRRIVLASSGELVAAAVACPIIRTRWMPGTYVLAISGLANRASAIAR